MDRALHRPASATASALLASALVLTLAPAALAAGPDLRILDGERNVDVEPLAARGTYVRKVIVEGAHRERVLRALRGPANGPLGFAPDFVSETPVREQVQGDRIVARAMRIRGAPAAAGSDVLASFTEAGLTARLSGGAVEGGFEITVGPEDTAADGRPRVEVTEVGRFHLLGGAPRSIFGVPRWLFAQWTPMGWLMQAMGGAAVSAGHIKFFALEHALEARLTSGLPGYE